MSKKLQLNPILNALTEKSLSNEDVMSLLEARFRKQITNDIKNNNEKEKENYKAIYNLEREAEDIVNEIVDKWICDNYITISIGGRLIGLPEEFLTLEELQYEAKFRHSSYIGSAYRKTTIDDKIIRIAIDLYPQKTDEDKDDIKSENQFLIGKAIPMPKEVKESLKIIEDKLAVLNTENHNLGNKVYQLKKEKEQCKYKVEQFKGEFLDEMMSKTEQGQQAQIFLDSVVSKIRIN